MDDTIFDQMLIHFCEYSRSIRVLVFEYSYERIWKSIRILFVVRSNEPRIPELRIRGYEYQHYAMVYPECGYKYDVPLFSVFARTVRTAHELSEQLANSPYTTSAVTRYVFAECLGRAICATSLNVSILLSSCE